MVTHIKQLVLVNNVGWLKFKICITWFFRSLNSSWRCASQLDDGFVYTGIDDYDIVGNGRYYSWGSAAGAVPYAWHLPTAEEFEALLLDNNGIDLQVNGVTGFDAQMSGGVIMQTGELEYLLYGNSSFCGRPQN